MLDHVLLFEGKSKTSILKMLNINQNFVADNGSGLDSYAVLNNLPQ